MTLILTTINKNLITQASDTRLTGANGVMVDDNAVKCIKLDCADGSFLIAYTGLAKVSGVKTDHWLVDVLIDFKAARKPIGEVINHLRKELDTYFAALKIDKSYKMTTVVIAGWQQARPVLFSLSNCEDENLKMLPTAQDTFTINVGRLSEKVKNGYVVMLNGTEPAIDERYFDRRMKRLIKILRGAATDEDARAIRNQSVGLIRVGASHPKWGKYIGKNCITATLPKEPANADCEYYPESDKKRLFAPHFVSGGMAAKDIMVGGRGIADGTFQIGWRSKE